MWWSLKNLRSLWRISKLSILCLFWHFLQYLLTYSHNETPFNQEKWKIFKALMHFDWNILSFQILCHCDISVNCPFYGFFDTFCYIYWLTITMQLILIKENKKYSKLVFVLTEIWTVFQFRDIVTILTNNALRKEKQCFTSKISFSYCQIHTT